MEDIVNKLKNAKKGEFIYDPDTGVTYEILEANTNGDMPISIVR